MTPTFGTCRGALCLGERVSSVFFGGGGEEGGGTQLLPTFASWPVTTHPVRGAALFLLLIETPPNNWAL